MTKTENKMSELLELLTNSLQPVVTSISVNIFFKSECIAPTPSTIVEQTNINITWTTFHTMESYGKKSSSQKNSTVAAIIAKANKEEQSAPKKVSFKIYSKSDQNPCTFSVLDSSVMLGT